MNNIQILDCTLRDGGYCNDWNFGFNNIKKITHGLQEAGIEIIECGFLTNQIVYNTDTTKFATIDQIAEIIPESREGKMFVAMVNCGEFDVETLSPYDGRSIDGIRVAFHKNSLDEAIELCKKIKEKGYLVFIQAMVSLSYSDEEFLSLIRIVNEFEPYAFYIVDSFGMMNSKDLTRLFYMVEHNLKESIWIGFHSHNNIQLAYSNAQQLIRVQTSRNLIIDSSIYGMGRGAGNLNTELFLQYLNENIGKHYLLKPILIIIDEILNDFYQQNYWGYSLSNYISATHNAHPNYAGYLDDRKTLTIEGINDIFDLMDEEKKNSFDKTYIEELYFQYMDHKTELEEHKVELEGMLAGKIVLLIAPGKSSVEEKNKIINFVKLNDIIVISINHVYEFTKLDFIFLSNIRRFKELDPHYYKKCIVTSNIATTDVYYHSKYGNLINHEEMVRDNAGLMAIKFLILYKVDKIFLAGFDGYSHDINENYGNSEMTIIQRDAVLDAVNVGMINVLKEYKALVNIEFLTFPRMIDIT